ncbi:MAG: D-amino-acid transaminase [Acidisphaera sp.]|nr:D-amino-acid transaminase [Acidisphaera sp.]MBV9783730.1 D-amino-acid transaminase [Acidisphaera sp.]
MSRIAYVNGRYVPQHAAQVNVEDRGYQFADGIYEVFHVYEGRLMEDELHFARLDRSLRELRMDAPMGRAAMRHVLQEVIERNRVREGLLYIQITRGVARRDHAFPVGVPPSLVVTIRRIPPYPRDVESWTMSAITQPDERWARCDIKTVGLLPNCLARQAAREQGAGEAILVDAQGMVTEGAATSFWIVDEAGVLRVRHLDNHILPGCTRAALIELLGEEGIGFEERAFSVEEMRRAREAFITGATSFVKPVVRIDGAPVGDGAVGPVTRRLFEMFSRHVRGNLKNAA